MPVIQLFAGNTYLISLDILVEKGIVNSNEVKEVELPSGLSVDYELACKNKDILFAVASERFYKELKAIKKKTLKYLRKKISIGLKIMLYFLLVLNIMVCSLGILGMKILHREHQLR